MILSNSRGGKKMEENKHNLINTFMEEAIKRSIHTHEKNI